MNTLFIHWSPDPILLHLGPISLRYYGLLWVIGLMFGYAIMHRQFQRRNIDEKTFEPLFIYCMIGIIAGARLGHCIFYEPGRYLDSLPHIIEMLLPIRFTAHGVKLVGYAGLASHGGVIGMAIALWLYSRKMKINFMKLADMILVATPVVAGFIRLANLMNSEIIGKVTDKPWAFIFERVDMLPRHPAQLYESIAYFILFGIQWTILTRCKHLKTGFLFGFGMAYIFIFRFLIEFIKEDQVGFEQSMWLNMGQILSIPMILVGFYCMFSYGRKKIN